MRIIIHLAVLAGVVLLSSRYLDGVRIKNTPTALGVAAVFSLINWALVWPLRALFFIPAILTLGLLFLVLPLIINAIVLWVTDKVLKPFEITNARALWLMALFITIANAVLRVALRRMA